MMYGKCQTCKKKRFFIKRRSIVLPTGMSALSQKLICGRCQKVIQKAIQLK